MDKNKIAEKQYISDAPISSVSVQISTDKIYRLIEDKNSAERINVSFGDVVSSVIAKILPDYPELTNHLDVDLGYLVNISKGLKTIVIKNASKKSLTELSIEIKNKILNYLHDELDETEKSSIIVNNLAPFNAFHVISPIYSGMVATIAICSEYPAVEFEGEKQIFIKKFNLALSFDARAINCQRALEFLNDVKKSLETA